MKFTEGVWYGREDIDIASAQEVGKLQLDCLARPYYPSLSDALPQFHDQIDQDDLQSQAMRVLFHTRPVGTRGDTLNKPTLTTTISSPCAGIIQVETKHFSARPALPEPRVVLFPGGGDLSEKSKKIVFHNEGTRNQQPSLVSFYSDGGQSRVDLDLGRGEFGIKFYGSSSSDNKTNPGKLLTEIRSDSLSWVLDKNVSPKAAVRENAVTTISDPYHRPPSSRRQGYMKVALNLAVGEKVYGLGERFGPFIKNGQTVELSNEDGGTSSSAAYKNIAFYMTNRGYGVYYDHTDHVSVEVQSDIMTKVQASVPGETIRFHLIAGSTPKEILTRYTLLTGRAPLPPDWSYGLWLSTSFLTSYDEGTVTRFVQGMQDRDIPLHVFHFDCFWMPAHAWCNFTFDPEFFPDPAGFLGRLHERGLKVCVWINPYIGQESRLFAEGDEAGYFLRRTDGQVWQTDDWQAGMALVDFTNPEGMEWYKNELRGLVRLGVDCFKTDFGERIPTEGVVYHDGSNPRAMHNYYTQLYNKAVWDVLVEEKGADQACLFARSAVAGGQTLPVHWGGDCDQEWTGMAETIRGGLSLSLSGFGYFSHDIAGFKAEGKNSSVHKGRNNEAAIYKRWVQFGLLSSHSRLHGSDTYRVPWMFDDESSVILSKFTKLKNRLEPYLTTLSIEGVVKQGHPIMRATFLEFPDDPVAWMLDQQYMLGHALLVAPIFDDREVEYYVPRGSWVNVLTGTVVTGPGFVTETHSFSTLPLLLRQNTGLIIGREGHTVLDKISDVNKGFTVIVGSNSDENFEVTAFLRDGHQITAHVAVEKDENAKTTSLTVVITSSALKELSWEILVVGNGSSLGEPRLLFSPTGPGRCNISLLAV